MDVLVLAALEGQITAANAGTVRARILAEAANGPIDPDADPILSQRRRVIPDILCNAGGVIVSYFEWAQNRAALAWTLDEINERLRAADPDGRRRCLGALRCRWDRAAACGSGHRRRARGRGDRPARAVPVTRSRFLPGPAAAHSAGPRPPHPATAA